MTISSRSLSVLMVPVLALAAASPAARAEESGPPLAPQEDVSVLTAARDAGGTHAILLLRTDGKLAVFYGEGKGLKQLDIVDVERFSPSFIVDTVQQGTMVFNTRDHTALIRGSGVGFTAKRLSRTFNEKPSTRVVNRIVARYRAPAQAQAQAQAEAPAGPIRVVTRLLQRLGRRQKAASGQSGVARLNEARSRALRRVRAQARRRR
jgi:hypothetical protein